MRIPYGDIVEGAINDFLANAKFPPPPYTVSDKKQASAELLQCIVTPIEAANAVLPSKSRYPVPTELPPIAICHLLLKFYHFKFVNLGAGNEDSDVPAVYVADGPHKGLYSTTETEINKCIRTFNPNLTDNQIKNIISILRGMTEHVSRCGDKNLIPVNNGVFDYKKKQLLPFSPDYIFLTKTKVNYVDNPINQIIHNPSDGTDWDVESWIQSLSDDPEIVELLWQVLGAVVRPGEAWDRVIFLFSQKGNNGKGTFCVLLRNLCGDGAHVSLQISDFDKDFMLENLVTASAIITDENDVGDYIDHAGNFKAVATHDMISINRKYKAAIPFKYTGIMVQCINGLPRFRDKSDSLYRRILAVPFDKCFTGRERKYIKHDYLNRPEVLEYVLHKVLHTDYHHFSEPAACKRLLAEYKTENDTIRQFAEEILPLCAWDLLPFTFLYDLYVSWMNRFYSGTKPLGRNNFIVNLLDVLSDYPEWECADRGKEYMTKTYMDKPEPLILEYEMDRWCNPSYQGPDPAKRCTICPKPKYRGIFRTAARVLAVPGKNDDKADSGAA